MPFGQTGANWLLLDSAVEHRRTAYDPDEAAARIRQSDYPHAEAFARGNVLSVPGKESALDMLGQLARKQARST